jgi:adenylate cyclase
MEKDVLSHMNDKEIRLHQKNIKRSKYNVVRWESGSKQVPLLTAVAPQSNIPVISTAARYVGYFNMITDDLDGVVRKIPGVIQFGKDLYAPLSLKTVSAFWNASLKTKVSAEYGFHNIQIGNVTIPTDKLGQILVNYRGGAGTFPHIPVTDILNGNIPENAIRDKIVMVGATALGIYDMRATPFGTVFPGLEIHATIVDSVLSEDFLYRPDWIALFDIASIIFLGLCIGFVLPRSGVITGAVISIFLFIGYIMLCQFLFSHHGLILNVVYPLIIIAWVYIGITVYHYFSETKQKRFIKNAFSTYLAPMVVKQLIETPENLVLGGEERNITAFFSDVQGFTSISENLRPTELVELLNEFLTEMTDIILKNQGTVDKFEGDAIIAFFGAPNDIPNHAEIACISCIAMQQRLAELRKKWKTEGKPELRMRIGLSTGLAVVGNMGSKNRMDYTMMGDTVNTAARLEGVNKVYGLYTLISETTYSAVSDKIQMREIDSINVVGKTEPIKIYELIGYEEDMDQTKRKTIDHYHAGLNAYRAQDWDLAEKFFHAALEVQPEDGPSRTMLARCREFKNNPPGKDWNGSYSMTSK